ncbi:cytochrome C [Sulfurimonas lithotrophica]|uniref:Cytochrome C n=1 Tax=Sulfurimonas lithotrophica TaxID=2590022 RepID=A0A5P8P2I6_9BACT|nr:cytochrome C [Sulfurimonas lithotrophica]QFR49894.1 cytochrome C [Sulfurimonas lithotrophica]
MKKIVFLFIFFSTLAFSANECVVCHKGIEDIRDRNSSMMSEILKIADKAGHKGNDCIVCHGGNPYNKSKEYGHKGTIKYFKDNEGPKDFYPSPTDPLVNKNTCGMCHESQVDAQYSSMMMDIKVDVNETNTSEYLHKKIGSEQFLAYMDKLSKQESEAFSKKSKIPHSKFSHNKGCAVCHIPYAKDGLYKGSDVRINKKRSNHLLVHQIQSSSNVIVNVDDNNYSGVSVQTCARCHSDKKFTALSYQGLLDTGDKHHLHMQEDIHFKRGMLCQDCHTSNDMHGSGLVSNENLAAVEIECQDCHGTTKKYPWELPLGYSDEYNTTLSNDKGRGVVKDVAKYLKQGFVADAKDGYLLSARANPLPNVVRKENSVIVHLANGKNIELKPLKLLKIKKELSKDALVAMDAIDAHTNKLECYTCHVTWTPQYYKSKQNKLLRWEDPALAQNGEGRISPVIQKNHKSLTAQPHNISKKTRTCESCHSSNKAMGFGIDGVKSSFTKVKEIDSNFTLASTLSKEQLNKLDRRGMCLSCHESIPKGNLAVSVMTHAAEMAELNIDTKMHKNILYQILHIGAWTQVLGAVLVLLIIAYLIYANFIKKKPVNPRNEGWK